MPRSSLPNSSGGAFWVSLPEVLLQPLCQREAADHSGNQQPAVVLHRSQQIAVGKALCRDHQGLEKRTQTGQAFKVEDAEAHKDHQLAVNMPYHKGDFLHALFAQLLLQQNKQPEV